MTRRCLLAPQTWAYGAAVTATSEHPQHPATKMLKDQPRERFQADAGIRSITIDVTRTEEAGISVVAPLFTNIDNEHASWRVRIAHAGEIDTTPWADSARIFGGTGTPFGLCLRQPAEGARIDWANTGTMTASFTIEALVRVFHTAFDYVIFRQLTGSNEPTFYIDATRHLGFVRTGKVNTLTSEALNEHEWTHVAVVYDSAASEVRLFLNGVRVQTVGSVTVPLGGASTIDGESVADGLDMDEFRLWNVARSDADILANAFDPIADQAGLVCYLQFEEGGGATLNDSHSGGPGATQLGCYWMWPERLWASPLLEGLPRTHGLWWDEYGGMASEVRIDILDPVGTDPISIGTLLLSNGWRPERNISEGSSPFGVQDFGSRETAPNGVTHVTRGAAIDLRTLLFLSTSHDEMYQLWHRLAFGVSNSIPLLFCSDPTDPLYRFQRMIYGVFDGPIIPTETRGPVYRLRTGIRAMS